jgi:hypothetical protein
VLPSHDQYDFCHGCGVHFRIETWSSWNTIGGVLYSDGFFVSPMSPRDDVFKCPECGAVIDQWSWVPKDLDEPMYDAPGLVDLELATFSEAFDAVSQRAKEGIGVNRLIQMRYQLWILGNHVRRDDNRDLPLSPYEIENVNLLLIMVTPAADYQLLRAMLLRALGRFEECKAILLDFVCNSETELELKKLNHLLQAHSDSRVGKWDVEL